MKPIPMIIRRGAEEPTEAQAKAGNYPKRSIPWNGLTIRIENEAGTLRRGNGWQTRLKFPYGYFERSTGVDGDEVDVIVGPSLDTATEVYVVHQRKYGDWERYDEDKCCVGFLSQDETKHAFLANYNDPRFLGPITAMPVVEFVAKVRATYEKPAMIKALLLKGFVRPYSYIRGGVKPVHVGAHQTRRPSKGPFKDGRQLVLFPKHDPAAVAPYPKEVAEHPERHTVDMFNGTTAAEEEKKATKKFYVTMIRDPGPNQRVGWLAGPFDTHEEAKAHVDPARRKASELDPRSDFDAFGTASREAEHHPPGVLNRHLGLPRENGDAGRPA